MVGNNLPKSETVPKKQLGSANPICLLGLVLGCTLVAGCAGNPSRPPVNATGTVAFSSLGALDGTDTQNGATNIWVARGDGSGARPITNLTTGGALNTLDLVWSPDGSKLAFISDRALDGSSGPPTDLNVWVMNADGSGATPLTKLSAAACGNIAWSPNGQSLVFDSNRALDGSNAVNINGTRNVWVINVDGSGALPLTRMTAFNGDASLPVWSHDGKTIVYSSARALDGSDTTTANTSVWVVNPDGSGSAALILLAAEAVYSPDGTKVAFFSVNAINGTTPAPGTVNIWVGAAPNGSGGVPVTKYTAAGIALDGLFYWSPDSKKIAFTSSAALDGSNAQNTNNADNVWVGNVDGSGSSPVTKYTFSEGAFGNTRGGAFGYGWSPAGTRPTYSSSAALDGSNTLSPTNAHNVWVVNADGTNATPLTRLTAAGSLFPAWKP